MPLGITRPLPHKGHKIDWTAPWLIGSFPGDFVDGNIEFKLGAGTLKLVPATTMSASTFGIEKNAHGTFAPWQICEPT